jgi:aspartyl-tRNA(Asn)/glutamyl-tRNA(Gln) amidotransferase subunit C
MSASTTASSATLSAKDVENIANLSRLAINETQATAYASSLNNILTLMQALQSIDTTGIEPLKSPFDNPQPLRADSVTEPNRREAYQAIAPATQDGLYLVPRVIE